MEFETTAKGFILKVNADRGPTIEWNASKEEVSLLVSTRDRHGKLGPNSKRFMVYVKCHANMSPSVSVYPLQ